MQSIGKRGKTRKKTLKLDKMKFLSEWTLFKSYTAVVFPILKT
jgi:hypothetical protein